MKEKVQGRLFVNKLDANRGVQWRKPNTIGFCTPAEVHTKVNQPAKEYRINPTHSIHRRNETLNIDDLFPETMLLTPGFGLKGSRLGVRACPVLEVVLNVKALVKREG